MTNGKKSRPNLTHLDSKGNPQMVDIQQKGVTDREALAEGWVLIDDSTIEAIDNQQVKKGDVLKVAHLAGIMGSKNCAQLIPLCHPIPVDGVTMNLELVLKKGVHITALVKTRWKTGVEMEALTAVTASALTVYDMVKAIDKGACITNIQLLRKKGGKSGEWAKK